MAERYCENCGEGLSEQARFCPNCGRPAEETARVATPEADVSPPPAPVPPTASVPTVPTPSYGAAGGFFRSFGLGAGACIGMVVAFMILFVGCSAIIVAASGGG